MATSTEIRFRAPEVSDLPRVAEIYNYAIRETAATFDMEEKAPSHFLAFIPGDHLHRMLIAEVGSEVVAFGGSYAFSQRQAYSQFAEMMAYVHPDWQRHGVGKALLREIHGEEFLRGLHTVLGLCNKENVHTQRLLDAMGYICKGEMTDVAEKFGKRHSLLIYQRTVKPLKPSL